MNNPEWKARQNRIIESARLTDKEFESVDDVTKAAKAKVHKMIEERNLTMDMCYSLLNTPHDPGGSWTLLGAQFSRDEVFEILDKVAAKTKKPIKPEPSCYFSTARMESLKLLSGVEENKESIVVNVGSKKPKDALRHLEQLRTEMIETSGPSLGSTSVALGSEDPYRTAGKRPMEDVLRDAGIEHEIIISLQVLEGEWTDDQVQLLRDLGDTNPNIHFLSNRRSTIELALNAFDIEPRPSAWQRFKESFACWIISSITPTVRLPHGKDEGIK